MKNSLLLVLLASSAVAAQASPGDATRTKMLALLDRPRVPLAPEVRQLPSAAGLTQEHVTFDVAANEQVPALVVKATRWNGRRPAVIQLHGTGGNKEQLVPRLTALANRGFVAVAIDGRYHGERAGNRPGLANPYSNAIFHAFKTGAEHPFFYDTIWDVMRLVDYLQTRPDVDGSRIGLGGFSKGGIETYLTAAVDPRIGAAVSGHGVQSFRWALDHGAWDSRAWTIRDAVEAAAEESKTGVSPAFLRRFYDRVAPGLLAEFDGPAMLPLVAPRPLLVINGDSDPRTPLAGVTESGDAATRAYAAAGASERFVLKIEAGVGHEQTRLYDEAMIEWFVRWLHPE